MKICIIIAHKRFEYFRFAAFHPRQHHYSIWLIMPKYAESLFDKSLENYLDRVCVVDKLDYSNMKEVIQEALKIQPDKNNIKILCNDEMFLLDVGKMRHDLGLQGPVYEDYLRFRDKIYMKELLSKAGINVPKFLRVQLDELRASPRNEYLKLKLFFNNNDFFVKPSRGASAIGAFKISTYSKFQNWIFNNQLENNYNCEEYINGNLYLCDSFVNQGQVVLSMACEYSYPCLDYAHGKPLGIMPLQPGNIIHDEITKLSTKICKILQAPDGVTHLEVFIKPNQELIFVEIGARPGGAGVPKIFEENFGFNTYQETLRQALDLQLNTKSHNNITNYAEIFWPQKSGRVQKIINPGLPSIQKIDWKVKVGDILEADPSGTITPIAVKIHLSSDNYNQCYQDFIQLKTFNPVVYANE